jgi:aminoglycoside phosphotransferase (APT) family kinase protein
VDLPSGLEHAVAALEPGGRLVAARELTGGVSATVIGLDIATALGHHRRVVFRQHRGAEFKQHERRVTRKEFHVLTALHRRGMAVPEPFGYDDSGAVIDPYLIVEWVDGSTELDAVHVTAAIDQMADFLVALHALDVAGMDVPELEPIEDPRVAVVRYLPSTAAGANVRAALARAPSTDSGTRPVLLHGDYWPGNVMWRDGRLIAVIDWEDACLGDPVADLATARVELLCQHGRAAMDHFTAQYIAGHHDAIGPLRLDSLTIWDVYVSAAALATMASWGLAPDAEKRRRRRTGRFFRRAAGELDRSLR